MAHDKLTADIGAIRKAATNVTEIKHAFGSTESLVEAYADDLGHSGLVEKMREFADNWRIHRERLTKDLDKFSSWATQAADAFEKSDQDLATILQEGPKK